MKKLQLSILILSFLWISHAVAGIFTVIPEFGINYSNLECSLQSAPASVVSNIADSTFLYTGLNPNFALRPHISTDAGTEDINVDTDIDTADSADGFEMNDRDVSLTSTALKEIPALIVQSMALKVFNFPPEVSRLRI
jgi:hypothetical protein